MKPLSNAEPTAAVAVAPTARVPDMPRIRPLTQVLLGVLYDLKPPRCRYLPAIFARWVHYQRASADEGRLPPVDRHPIGPQGFLGFSSDMSVAALKHAYTHGAYPMTHYGPVRWYAPPRRGVLHIENFRLPNDLKRLLRKSAFRVTLDKAPREVMQFCAAPRRKQWPLSWITPGVIDAYLALYTAGIVHSVEVWNADEQLVGGLFGTTVGPVFVVESLFHLTSDSSKYGLAVLIAHLHAWGFRYVDYKQLSQHSARYGFSEISRADYQAILDSASTLTAPAGPWQFDPGLDLGDWNPKNGPPPRIV